MTALGPYLLLFAVAAGVTAVLTPLCAAVATKVGVVATPGLRDRDVHEKTTPYLGGVAMLGGVATAIFLAARIAPFRDALEGRSELIGVLVGAVVVVAIGTLDDWREVSAPARLATQILAGSVISLFGVTILYFRIPFGDFLVLGRDLRTIATVVWVIGMTNAINAIDGLDGLAAGVVAIGSAAFFVFALLSLRNGYVDPSNTGALVAAVTAGVSVGFLPFNWNPARIFMGDGGAYLLGLLLASSTILIGGNSPDVFPGRTYFFYAPLVVPIVILGVAIFDAGFAIVRRLFRRVFHRSRVRNGELRRSWHHADAEHVHHRLLRLGHGHKRAVLILWAWTALLSAVVLVPTFSGASQAGLPLLVAAILVGLFTFLRPGFRSRRSGQSKACGASVADTPTKR